MNVLKKQIKLEDELSTSGIFRILQDVSAIHCAQFDLSMEDLDSKGLIWVVVRQFIQLERMPQKGEELEISTWPGVTRHMMFPRFYIIKDAEGREVLRGSAIWTIVDRKTRTMVIPKNYGLALEGIQTGEECKLPASIKKHELSKQSSFTVPQEYIDANKHMNNTRYYDAVEKCLGDTLKGRHIKEAVTEYVSEAVLGEEVKLSWDEIDGRIFVTGENQGIVFKMNLLYE